MVYQLIIDGSGTAVPQVSSLKDGAILLGAITLLLISLILLYETTTLYQRKPIGQATPQPKVLQQMYPSILLSAAVLGAWVWFVFDNQLLFVFDNHGELDGASLLWLLRRQPRDFAPGFLIAATIPSVTSMLRFLAALARLRTKAVSSPAKTVGLTGLVIAILSIAGSIASLLSFFRP